jgi:hypothetical protein
MLITYSSFKFVKEPNTPSGMVPVNELLPRYLLSRKQSVRTQNHDRNLKQPGVHIVEQMKFEVVNAFDIQILEVAQG